jgi:hypothetical protein
VFGFTRTSSEQPGALEPLTAAHEAPDSGHQLGCALLLKLGLGAHYAGVGVSVEQTKRDLIQRGLYSADLSEDVDAVAVLSDHALDAADLALDASKAVEQLILGCLVALPSR